MFWYLLYRLLRYTFTEDDKWSLDRTCWWVLILSVLFWVVLALGALWGLWEFILGY